MTDLTDAAAARARAAGKNIGSAARTLGRVDLTTETPARSAVDQQLADQALALLREEVDRVQRIRQQLAVESAHGAPGGHAHLDAMAAAVEGATRFALRMGLVTPGEARSVWAAARATGLRSDTPTNTTDREGTTHE